jgi:hypothetical protein
MINRLFVVYKTIRDDIVLVTCDRPKPSVRNSDLTPTLDFVNRVLMKSYDLQGYSREELLKGHVVYAEYGDYVQYIKD